MCGWEVILERKSDQKMHKIWEIFIKIPLLKLRNILYLCCSEICLTPLVPLANPIGFVFENRELVDMTSSLLTIMRMINNSCSILVSSTTFIAAYVYPNNLSVALLVCALLNAVNGKLLKVILGRRRPDCSAKGTYGMPSSHANSLFYFVGFLTYASYENPRIDAVGVCCICFCLFVYTMIVCFCRVEIDRDHTWMQVCFP